MSALSRVLPRCRLTTVTCQTIRSQSHRPTQGAQTQKPPSYKPRYLNVERPQVQFGELASEESLQTSHMITSKSLDDGDGELEYESKIADTSRPKPTHYLKKINDIIYKEHNLQAALEVFDSDMKADYVKPNEKHYRVLIHACGRAGYHKKAFDLFRDYNSRNFRPNFGILADLFNACANSPEREDALRRAQRLRENLLQRNTIVPPVVYNNMIKAFGRLGAIDVSFALVDEMKELKIPICEFTVSNLLQACISDKETGFRHAIIAWRLVKNELKSHKFDVSQFNLLLRAATECGVGDPSLTSDILLECLSVKEARLLGQRRQAKPKLVTGTEQSANIHPGNNPTVQDEESLQFVTSSREKSETALVMLPNLIEARPNFENVVDLGPMNTPQDRFIAIGGLEGFLKELEIEGAKPNEKTFSQMLPLIEGTEEAELNLLERMKLARVRPDIAIFNQIIIRRKIRRERQLALATLDLVHEYGLIPDMITYGSLASCCLKLADAKRLLANMRALSVRPTARIYQIFLKDATFELSPRKVKFILEEMDKNSIRPSPDILRLIETFNNKFKKCVIECESGSNTDKIPKAVLHEKNQGYEGYRNFLTYYKSWLEKSDVKIPKHPWYQFLTSNEIEKGERMRSLANIINHGKLETLESDSK